MSTELIDECKNCKYEESTDIKEHMEFCLHCKRAYLVKEERDLHKDLFVEKKV